MIYICHNRFKGKCMSGGKILVRRGKLLRREGDILYYQGAPVCVYRSLVGKRHFARNDDGHGLARGALTYALAYANRVRYGGTDNHIRQRFTDVELETLHTRWSQYLKPGLDVLLFNDDFFEESPEVLRQIAASVNIDILYAQGGHTCTAS